MLYLDEYGELRHLMKKLIIAATLLVLAGAVAVHYYPEQAEPLLQGTPLKEMVATSKPVYQWQDDKGQWHITDAPPPKGIPYEVKRYPLDTNVLPPYEPDTD